MNEVTTVSAAEPAPPAGVAPRGPVKTVQVLLPVWGHRFIRQFLEFCLPTLLAPGNVPALAKALPCRFVIMTSVNDVGTIQMHPAWVHLSRICETEIHLIDDLITDGNHSATITLAYARVVREKRDTLKVMT